MGLLDHLIDQNMIKDASEFLKKINTEQDNQTTRLIDMCEEIKAMRTDVNAMKKKFEKILLDEN